ncbi:hypothetical protein [Myxosarcina sp. GI1(2024)]
MSKENYPIGYEALLLDFERYRKQSTNGVTLARKPSGIYLQFKTPNKPRRQYPCNCSFSIDGMQSALVKANKVTEALKSFDTESEFWEWYDREIREESQLENDLVTFAETIAIVEEDFWSRPSRTGRRRNRTNPSDHSSYYDTYGRFYKYLPQDKAVTLKTIMGTINRWEKGTKSYKGVVSAMKRLTRMAGKRKILDELDNLNITQTKFQNLQSIDLEEFIEWREAVLTNNHPNVNKEVRRAWLWVFSVQVVYGLRVHEVFAIQNLECPFVTVDRVTIPPMTEDARLIVVGQFTTLGTTTKTNYRLARSLVPPSHPDLIELLDIKKPLLPGNKPRSRSNDTIRKFYCNKATEQLRRWKCPVTQTHAFRHLANHNGIMAGIPKEIRALSMGHTPEMNESTYKRRRRTQTTIDLLLHYTKIVPTES